ncbi:hypothetical protein HXX76_009528 [Chlamydomonas incerta]|uniref:Cytochrome b561 domain-containing protein n=1 Tax=Chlamydomonas incerta TaxID=51695 RepID=A0A835SQU9_CHLIN|nr:hypothetical protein HXX76_009528 [Chlamydomonas incerta]|eukprot:KAG2431514.1 hypothetical protein HXX76_009528 [Chlamydomonas incerta]
MRPHGAPSTDSAIAFTVKSSANAAVASLCQGSSYTITVSYPQTRETLLTASLGSLGGSSSCPNKRVYTGDASSHSATFTLPCAVNGATSVTFKATTATSRWGAFLQASSTLPISSSCGCTSSSPPPAAASASPSPKPSPSATASSPSPSAASTPSPSLSPTTGAADSDTDSSSSSSTAAAATCATSSLGYACSISLPGGGGEALHWTAGTAAPPDNACTRSSSSSTTASSSSASAASENLVHFALSSPQSGYLSIGFTQRAGMMAPANAVIGRISSGSAIVETYYMTSYDLDPPTNNGWAAGAAVLSTSAGGTVLCFSVAADVAAAAGRRRQLATAGTAAAAPRRSLAATTATTTANASSLVNTLGLSAAGLEIIWATHNSADLTATHNRWGGVSLNALSGSASATAANSRRNQMLALHGALAAAGWVLLVPLGLLLARHRRNISVLRSAPRACGKDMWLVLHICCVVIGTACGAASIGVAVAELRGSGASDANTVAHRATGWAVLGLAVLQMLSGGVRPDPGAPRRKLWTFLHANLGRVATLLAWACTGLGVYLAVTRYSQDLTVWAAPLAATLALLLGAELGLTAAAALVAEAAYAAPPPGPDALLLPAPGLPFPPAAAVAHGDGVCVGYPAGDVAAALPTSRVQSQQQQQQQQQRQQQQSAAASTRSSSAAAGGGGGGSVPLAPLRRQPSPPSLGDSGYGDGALGLRAAQGNKK